MIAATLDREQPKETIVTWPWIIALVTIGLVFFLNEHNPRISLQQDFTDSADEMVASAGGGNAIRRLAFLTTALLGMALFVLPGGAKLGFPGPLAIFMCGMISLAAGSVLWASDPGMCVRRVMVLVFTWLGVVGCARRFSLVQLCYMAFFITGACISIGVLSEMALGTFRPWSGGYRFSGTLHPNTQGSYLAVCGAMSVCLAKYDAPRKPLYFLALGAAVVLLILTKSRTSTAGVIAMLGGLWWIMQPMRLRGWLPFFGLGCAACGLLALALAGVELDRYAEKIMFLGRQEETESFSGRTTIWPVVWSFIEQRYWLGYGYECFWTPDHIEYVTRECEWGVREAHSAYFDTMLSLGVVGVSLLVITVLTGAATSLGRYVTAGDACALPFMGLALNGLFNGLLESGMIMTIFPTFLLACGFARQAFFAERTAPRFAAAFDPAFELEAYSGSLG